MWYSAGTLPCVTSPKDPVPAASLIVCEQRGEVHYEAKFRYGGRQVKRRIGRAWLTPDGTGGWRPRRGRVADGYFDERRAHVAAADFVLSYVKDFNESERVERERRTRGVTFRELAHGYLEWLEKVRGAKPSTIRSHQSDLAEPGTPHKRGTGTTAGLVMAALGDRPAAQITPAEVEMLLQAVAATGVSARSVNRAREIVCAAFSYGMKPTTYSLPTNPALGTDRRRVPEPGVLLFYSPEEIEAIARSLEAGFHRPAVTTRGELELLEDRRDCEAVRVAAYAGIRLGELLALRWRDIDWTGSALTISRSLSSGIEGTTKTGHVRRVPMADQAAAALDRLSQREDFISPDDYVFCNALGRPLDGSALRRRYKNARDAAGLRPLRWHDLRHTFGSLLVASGVDLVSIKDAMGHSQLTTTSRYLHARPAGERAAAFTAAFRPSAPVDPTGATSLGFPRAGEGRGCSVDGDDPR
jgi:integrase